MDGCKAGLHTSNSKRRLIFRFQGIINVQVFLLLEEYVGFFSCLNIVVIITSVIPEPSGFCRKRLWKRLSASGKVLQGPSSQPAPRR